jgi:hypothetical protein
MTRRVRMKDHRINLRVDKATYERIANYADKNTFREISEGTRRLILEGLKAVSKELVTGK